MSTTHTATTTTTSSVAPSNLDSNREYNHAVYGSHLSPSVGSLHYALPQQSHSGRTIIPSGGDQAPSSSQQQHQEQQQSGPQMFHSPTHDLSQPQEPRSGGKRKQSELPGEDRGSKRRKQNSFGADGDEGTNGDNHGAKHWTDDEKTKFFLWLLGSDEHWEAFGTKMNTCFRECAQSIFAGRKTFTALKSCYHRNLETFKQLSSFEQFNGAFEVGIVDPSNHNERQIHFEKRLEHARTAGCPIGNLSPRVVDSWVRNGWFDLFKSRFYADPARPMLVMPPTTPPHHQIADPETQLPDAGIDQSPEPQSVHLHTQSPHLANGGANRQLILTPHPPSHHQNFQPPSTALHPPGPSAVDHTVAHLSALTQNLIATYAHMVQVQSEDSRAKLDLMKRREEREDEDSRLKRDMDKRREEREVAEWESTKEREKIKQKADLATQLLSNPNLEPSVKQAAGDYLKQLFTF